MSFKQENGIWFFNDENGIRVRNEWVQDENKLWYYMGKDGALVTGWFQTATDGAKWFYSYPEKTEKDGNTHYMGEMATGWIETNNKWYFLNPNEYNAAVSLSKGEMIEGTTEVIDNNTYTFDATGAMEEDAATSDSLISSDCLDCVKAWEGFTDSGAKYYDCCGILTQGYGMTGLEIADLPDVITEEVAASMLESLINKNYAAAVKADLDNKGVSLNQNQFDSLVTFAYNCGTSALFGSTLYSNVCNGVTDSEIITGDFQAWDKGEIDGEMQVIPGLLKRRNAEAAIFTDADYSGRP
jgi:lysozyme